MFIEEYSEAVSPELCERIIALFEADPRRAPSVASIAGKPAANSSRTGTHLVCGTDGEWGAVVQAIIPALQTTLRQYAEKYSGLKTVLETEGLVCSGPVIERVDPGQGFAWHFDQTSYSWQRVLAGLLYLRTVTDGGATEFRDQNIDIRPQAGKIALFPPYWTHMHRGATPVSDSKYVMSFFWMYARTAKTP